MGRASIFISGTVSQMPTYNTVKTQNGERTVMRFNLPADHGWGERKVSTFFECEHWMAPTEKAMNYLSHAMGKGAKVAVVGEPYIHRWTGKDGNERTSIRVDVSALDVLQAAPEVDVKDEPRAAASAPQNGSDDLYDESIPF